MVKQVKAESEVFEKDHDLKRCGCTKECGIQTNSISPFSLLPSRGGRRSEARKMHLHCIKFIIAVKADTIILRTLYMTLQTRKPVKYCFEYHELSN